MSGNLGYELDLTKITEEEKLLIKEQISKYKEIRNIVQFGDFYRILSPFECNETAWNIVSEDKERRVCRNVFQDTFGTWNCNKNIKV